MSKQLIIAEKPSVAADIAKALGGGFKTVREGDCSYRESDEMIITSGIGHLCQIRCPADQDPGNNLDRLPAIPTPFEIGAIEKTEKQLKMVVKLIRRADVDSIVNACDAGREGELIFRYIVQYAESQKPTYRMWMQSMTEAAILDAYTSMQPGHHYDLLAAAAQTRSEADWIIGINGTRAVTEFDKTMTGKPDITTVGRVQTPVVALLADRETAIKCFVTKHFFEVQATLGDPQTPQHYVATWINPRHQPDPNQSDLTATRLFDRAQADALIAKCQGQHPSQVSDESSPVAVQPPKLFDLTSLQQEANKKLGFTAAKTLKIAQELYETQIAAITYPRTDANALPEDYIPTVQNTLTRIINAGHPLAGHAEIALNLVRPDKRIFNNAKISDHFAIIPTGKIPTQLTADQQNLYDLITRRFIAAFHPAAEYQRTVRTTIIAGETFHTRGNVLVTPGWMSVYTPDKADNQENESTAPLCHLLPGQRLPLTKITSTQGKTRPPPRYTEATLLSAMESAGADIEDEELRESMKSKGLGTPATRAATIEKIITVGYAERDKTIIQITAKGSQLIQLLRTYHLAYLTSATTTGEWEHALTLIETGQISREQFMQQIHKLAHQLVHQVRTLIGNIPLEQRKAGSTPTQSHHHCPDCQQPLTSDQKSLSCSCGFKLWRTMFSKTLTDQQITTLLTTGQHPPINGLISSRTKKSFSAGLTLVPGEKGKVDLVFQK